MPRSKEERRHQNQFQVELTSNRKTLRNCYNPNVRREKKSGTSVFSRACFFYHRCTLRRHYTRLRRGCAALPSGDPSLLPHTPCSTSPPRLPLSASSPIEEELRESSMMGESRVVAGGGGPGGSHGGSMEDAPIPR